VLGITLSNIDRRILALKTVLQELRSVAAAGPLASSRLLSLYTTLVTERAELVTAAATPGILQYARDQKDNQTLDVVAEFNALVGLIDDLIAWIGTNFPKDANGYLLAQTLGPTKPVDRTFTVAQTAGLRTQLDLLIAAIA
jgi:hypothetical protein